MFCIIKAMKVTKKDLSYILKLRDNLKPEHRNMPLFQNGSAIIVENSDKQILLQKRTDRDQWGLPGGLQELGETFEEVALRELQEETGLKASQDQLILIDVVSGESRKNSYPNGDEVYNNTVLYLVRDYDGSLDNNHSEVIFDGEKYINSAESKELKFFNTSNLPKNLMDRDLIEKYLQFIDGLPT